MRRAVVALVALLSLAAAGAAAAATIGIADTPTSVALGPVTLNGDDQTVSWDETIAISGVTQALGYNVTAWAPLPAAGAKTLSALEVQTAPALSCTQGACRAGTNSVTTYPVVLGTTAGAAAKIFGATANSANKNQQAIVTITLPVHADAYPGTYTTTVTFTVSDGP